MGEGAKRSVIRPDGKGKAASSGEEAGEAKGSCLGLGDDGESLGSIRSSGESWALILVGREVPGAGCCPQGGTWLSPCPQPGCIPTQCPLWGSRCWEQRGEGTFHKLPPLHALNTSPDSFQAVS